MTYDGDGGRTKMVDVITEEDEFGNPVTTTTTRYYVSSSVTGTVITELDEAGVKTRSFVYSGGGVLAWQDKEAGVESVLWEYRDPGNASYRMRGPGGIKDTSRSAEMDPLNSNAGTHNPYINPTSHWPREDLTYPAFADMLSGACRIDGIPAPCSMTNQTLNSGGAAECPDGYCGPRRGYNPATKQYEWRVFRAFADGRQGYAPFGATSNGRGGITLANGNEGWGNLERTPENSLKNDIDAARAKVKNDKFCREALNKLLATTVAGFAKGEAFVDFLKIVDGQMARVDIFDGLDRLSQTNVVKTGKEGIQREGSMEYVNDLSVDVGGGTIYVNSSYGSRKWEEKVFALLHEALHMFSGFTDQQLAIGAQRAEGVKDKDIKLFNDPKTGQRQASVRVNDYIDRHCKGLSVGTGSTIRLN